MHEITMSLYRLAKQVGVKFYFNTPVKIVDKGKTKGVETNTGFHKSDNVVSNMDVVGTHKTTKFEKQPKPLKQPKSSSAIILLGN